MTTSLAAMVKALDDQLVEVMRESSAVMGETVVYATPILEGRLVNNWRTNIGPPISTDNPSTGLSPAPAAAQARSKARALRPGQTLTVANGTSYGPLIEFKGYSPGKAPKGMVRVSLAQWQSIVNRSKR